MPDHFPNCNALRPFPLDYHEPEKKPPEGPNWIMIIGVCAFIIAAAAAFVWSNL